MLVPSAGATAAAAYAKVEKMDAEEARHVKAQFLIQKVLEEATASTSTSSARPPRRPAAALARAKARIGVRLKKLRLAFRGVRVRARRAVQRHLRNLMRLIAHGGGGGGQGSAGKNAAVAPSAASSVRTSNNAVAAAAVV